MQSSVLRRFRKTFPLQICTKFPLPKRLNLYTSFLPKLDIPRKARANPRPVLMQEKPMAIMHALLHLRLWNRSAVILTPEDTNGLSRAIDPLLTLVLFLSNPSFFTAANSNCPLHLYSQRRVHAVQDGTVLSRSHTFSITSLS